MVLDTCVAYLHLNLSAVLNTNKTKIAAHKIVCLHEKLKTSLSIFLKTPSRDIAIIVCRGDIFPALLSCGGFFLHICSLSFYLLPRLFLYSFPLYHPNCSPYSPLSSLTSSLPTLHRAVPNQTLEKLPPLAARYPKNRVLSGPSPGPIPTVQITISFRASGQPPFHLLETLAIFVASAGLVDTNRIVWLPG